MIQVGSYISIADNSGGRTAYCIHIHGYRRRYAYLGDVITVVVSRLRKKRKNISKVKRGNILKALVVKTKNPAKYFFEDSIQFLENSVILLNQKNKLIGTKIFGILPKSLRYTKFMKSIMLCKGLKS